MGENDDRDSHLGQGIEELARTARVLAARLLGPKAVGGEVDLDRPAISPEVDRAVEQTASSLGRWLDDAGRRMGAGDPGPGGEGWSPLALGARSFAAGAGSLLRDMLAGHGEE